MEAAGILFPACLLLKRSALLFWGLLLVIGFMTIVPLLVLGEASSVQTTNTLQDPRVMRLSAEWQPRRILQDRQSPKSYPPPEANALFTPRRSSPPAHKNVNRGAKGSSPSRSKPPPRG
ncbi:uncharacterized protein [Physcomitrium patens]|uniref:Uncharacterized protein n=2 Tax=Physcomitrium patens TaxID=3218 RepID=A9TMA3_PHYPA|nr:uncharacterized protein LOC112285074 [Physcomitrium patens]|eukprot:XP_024381363.1 uncharacterized protein LOC112285074 [Physcomitrella patens]